MYVMKKTIQERNKMSQGLLLVTLGLILIRFPG